MKRSVNPNVRGALQHGFLALVLLTMGCGARSEIPYDDPTGGAGDEDVVPAPQPQPRPNEPGTSGDRPLFESKELMDCEPGVSPNRAATCVWVANGLCYDTQDAACACVCPRSGASLCQAGLFENEFGAVEVNCDLR